MSPTYKTKAYKLNIDTSDRLQKKLQLIENSTGNFLDEVVGNIDVPTEIFKLLESHSIKPSDVEIVPFKGPGSFTGLKIGVTIANIFNWLLGTKTLDSLDYPEYGREPNISERKKP